MASREGDVLFAPGYTKGTEVKGDELLYSYDGLLQKGVTLVANQGVLEVGTPLEYVSGSKKYQKATAAANVKGFLRIAVDTGTSGAVSKLANIVLGGTIRYSVVPASTGVNDNATNRDAMVAALNGTYNAQFGFIKF